MESRETQAVTINQLEAQPNGKAITLDWKTLGELEVYYTLIQHSTDGVIYQTIQSLEGRNNNTLEHYTFTHERPQVGLNYYRIVLHMDSGEEFIFDEIEIKIDRFQADVTVFPNPTTAGVYLNMPDWITQADAQFTLIDMAGRVIQNYELLVSPEEEIYLDFSEAGISNGNYLITLSQASELILNTQLSIQN